MLDHELTLAQELLIVGIGVQFWHVSGPSLGGRPLREPASLNINDNVLVYEPKIIPSRYFLTGSAQLAAFLAVRDLGLVGFLPVRFAGDRFLPTAPATSAFKVRAMMRVMPSHIASGPTPRLTASISVAASRSIAAASTEASAMASV